MNDQTLVRLVVLSRQINWLVTAFIVLTLCVMAYMLVTLRLDRLRPSPRHITIRSSDIDLLGRVILMPVVVLRPGARAGRVSSLDVICKHLECQPGDLLEYRPDDEMLNDE